MSYEKSESQRGSKSNKQEVQNSEKHEQSDKIRGAKVIHEKKNEYRGESWWRGGSQETKNGLQWASFVIFLTNTLIEDKDIRSTAVKKEDKR